MLNREGSRRAGWLLFLLLCTISAALAGCGGQPSVNSPRATSTTPPSATVAPTATPDSTRIPYPWPMKQHKVPLSTNTVWVPADARVYQELEKDFLAFWTWSGEAGPASFPFLPDSAQISVLATPAYSAVLQNYVAQIQSTGQVTAYLAASNNPSGSPQQTMKGCTQDGLQCQCIYIFSPLTKTIYDAQSGKIIIQTANLEVVVSADQSYNQEMHRWQLSNITIQELPA